MECQRHSSPPLASPLPSASPLFQWHQVGKMREGAGSPTKLPPDQAAKVSLMASDTFLGIQNATRSLHSRECFLGLQPACICCRWSEEDCAPACSWLSRRGQNASLPKDPSLMPISPFQCHTNVPLPHSTQCWLMHSFPSPIQTKIVSKAMIVEAFERKAIKVWGTDGRMDMIEI